MINNRLTYISLFSSAGVGCFGFKMNQYECIATNELIERRLNIQKINNKCRYQSGYISGDITTSEVKEKIFKEIKKWEKEGNDGVDVLIATPPCQGMSVANHKKSDDEIVRNSLVVESIKMIQKVKPKFFVFENVPAFLKTACTAPDGKVKEIQTVIAEELGNEYNFYGKILNFKNYGSNSSRSRTIVIGISKKYQEFISPIELFPDYCEEKTLKEVLYGMKKLEWGEFDKNDFYHQFRTYSEHMRSWIHDLKEGESAFDNEDDTKKPHKVIDGKLVINQRKNSDKYTRQIWNKVAPCIHTRNDQMASQNTLHPEEDRVFSIRELMKLMTIPNEFKWINKSLEELNSLSLQEKKKQLKKEEINIRQSIGEAVPTKIFEKISKKISDFMFQKHLTNKEVNLIIEEYTLNDEKKLIKFIKENKLNLGNSTLARIAELTNSMRESNSAYYTNKFLVNEIVNKLPDAENEQIDILEPSVGVGNFLPLLIKKYENVKCVNIDVCDIDNKALEIVRILLEKIYIPKNIKINYICDDYLTHKFEKEYFLIIGNPPFTKLTANEAKKYLKDNINKETSNLFEFFLEKSMRLGRYVAMITPKSLLNTPEFIITREYIEKYKIDCIIDFGELGFKGVLVETICIFIDTKNQGNYTDVISITNGVNIKQKQKYICDKKLPYWVIYRNDFFDKIFDKMKFDIFSVFRDRQITNTNTELDRSDEYIRVIKSRNIDDFGKKIIDISGYDAYMRKETAKELSVFKYYNNENVYLTPNMTYKPRVMKNPRNTIVNGSVAILIPKHSLNLSEEDMLYFSTDEYREFYKIARNYQTRSLNIDSTSVYWFGVKKGE